MQTLILAAMMLGFLLPRAEAATPLPMCRSGCAARIERDCGSSVGSAFRRCQRKLLRACRRTTAAEACGGVDLDALMGAVTDKLLSVHRTDLLDPNRASETFEVLLCEDRRLEFVVRRAGDSGETEDRFSGSWDAEVVDGAALLVLEERRGRRFFVPAGLAADGTITLRGETAVVADGRARCERTTDSVLAAMKELVADRVFLVRGLGTADDVPLLLCGSGRYSLQRSATSVETGSWQLSQGEAGGSVFLVLTDDTGETDAFTLGIDGTGTVSLNGFVTGEPDPTLASAGRSICAGA